MIPIYKPFLNKDNLVYAYQAINSTWISSQGEFLDLVKSELKSLLNCKKIVLTNNGTTATHLLALALKFKYPNIKKIIVPNNVYVAAWNSFLFDKNYELIPIDADLETWNFDLNLIEEKLDDETAILVVHNLGNVLNVPQLKLRFPQTVIIEDNCEGLTGQYEGKYTGTESFASSISFFANKTITSGEGGAFMTNDKEVFDYINKIRNQGQSTEKFIHDYLGYNYRMTNLQAAILYGQLKSLDEIIEKKQRIFDRYRENLASLVNVKYQKKERNTKHSNWMFSVRFIDLTLEKKKELELFLYKMGVETRPMFYNINTHDHLKDIESINTNADLLMSQVIILPSYPDLSESQIDFICDLIKDFFRKKNE